MIYILEYTDFNLPKLLQAWLLLVMAITPPLRPKFPDLPQMLREEEERVKTKQKSQSDKPIKIWVDGWQVVAA